MRLPLPSRLPALLRLGEHFLTRDAAFAGAARWSRLQRGYATPAEDADAQRDAQGIGATDANMKNEIADNTENADVASDVSPFSPAARRARAVARFRALAAQAAATEPSPAAQFLPSVYNLPERSFGAANSLTLTSLLAANLHLGHAPRHLSHYMRPYVYGERAGIHIINLEHTLVALRRSMNVVREVAARGGAVVFVGTRLAIHKIAVDAARSCGQYFCIEWKEGLITNRERLLKRSTGFDPSKAVQSEPAPGVPPLTKQPKVHVPTLLVFLDLPNTMPALYEARQVGIPSIALVDTNMDPRLVTYPIPGNDDGINGVEFVANKLADAAREGLELRTAAVRSLANRAPRRSSKPAAAEGEAY